MNLDALVVGAVRRDIETMVLGGRVQHVHHPEELTVAIEVYANGKTQWLVLSAHPERARALVARERPARTADRVSPLLLLLRKYVDGGRLDSVEQPPLERVLRLHFSRRAPSGDVWRTELIVELMGRLSNLIVVDEDGSIIDAAKRVTSEVNRVRTVLPKQRYDPPPAQEKIDPRIVTPEAMVEAAAARNAHPGTSTTALALAGKRENRSKRGTVPTAAGLLVECLAACSPLLSREVVFRVHGRVDVTPEEADWGTICVALREMWQESDSNRLVPSIAVLEGRLVAFAAYPLRSYADATAVGSMSAALDRWFAERAAGPKPPSDAARRASFRAALLEAQDHLRAKRYSLGQSLVGENEVESLRLRGQALLAEGTQQAVDEAQAVFARYHKMKTAARDVPTMIESVEHELRYLDEALTLLDLAFGPDELNELRREWAELGYLAAGPVGLQPARKKTRGRHPKARARDAGPTAATGYRRVSLEGFDILVGKSGRGNDNLLSRVARPADIWLHARGVPGAHVVVRLGGRTLPDSVLQRAAALAAGHSQARTAPIVGVDYTLCKYVERVRGGPPGLANYKEERTLHVAPENSLG